MAVLDKDWPWQEVMAGWLNARTTQHPTGGFNNDTRPYDEGRVRRV